MSTSVPASPLLDVGPVESTGATDTAIDDSTRRPRDSASVRAVRVLREHAPLVAIVAAYGAARFIYQPDRPPLDPAALAQIVAVLGVVVLIAFPIRVLLEALRAPRVGSATLLGSLRTWLRISRRLLRVERLLGVALVVLAAAAVYAIYLEWKADIGLGVPFTWDARLAELDRVLHGGHHPWELLHPVLSVPAITRLIDFLYHPGWGLVLVGVPGLMAWSGDAVARMRFFLVFALAWIVLGTGVGYAFPSAGPVYLERIGGDHAPFAALLEYLARVDAATPLVAVRAADSLWHAYATESWPRLGISAMPSLHLAMATLAAMAAWDAGRIVRLLGILFLAVILLGSVHLGWHYAIDGYVSVLAVVVAWHVTGRWLRRLRARQLKRHRSYATNRIGWTQRGVTPGREEIAR